jgi:hypothetical protein
MIEETLQEIVTTIENLNDTLMSEKVGNNGQTIADSLEGIEYSLRSINETLELIANRLK